MATLHPSLSAWHPTSAGAYRERDVLLILEQGLSNGFDVFHGVHWSTVHQDLQRFGEIDVIAVAPSGHLVLMEVKAGEVTVSDDGVTKSYGGLTPKIKDVSHQTRRQHGALLGRLTDSGMGAVHVSHLLVLPDQAVSSSTVAYPRERIVDSTQMRELCDHLRSAVASLAPLPAGMRDRVLNFLSDRFHVVPDPSNHIGQVTRCSTVLADGLATWVPRVSHASGLYVIEATAGSGKTQLALALLQDAVRNKLRAAYVCYNRPLADHMVRVAPSAVEVSTFHEYCVDFARTCGHEPDFKSPGIFEKVVDELLEHSEKQPARLDLLIVDESQDFEPQWVQALLPRLKDASRLYVMGDPDQQLYARDSFDLSEAVQIKCMDNFRSPLRVTQAINQLGLAMDTVQGRSGFAGQAPEFHTYGTKPLAGITALEKCLVKLKLEGFTPEQMAVITFSGRERSEVLTCEKLAGLALKTFNGRHDAAGNPLWTEGDLLAETLYRFKGQSAPVVVLCEVDFETLGPKEVHKLFVGFTRAQFRLECVLSEKAATLLMQRMDEQP